jgi:hypothetical protein
MKKIILGLVALSSFSAFASEKCAEIDLSSADIKNGITADICSSDQLQFNDKSIKLQGVRVRFTDGLGEQSYNDIRSDKFHAKLSCQAFGYRTLLKKELKRTTRGYMSLKNLSITGRAYNDAPMMNSLDEVTCL